MPNTSNTSTLCPGAEKESEDWTKVTDIMKRRRIQNRIAQRNYRKKLKKRLKDLEKEAESGGDGSFLATSTTAQENDKQTWDWKPTEMSFPPSSQMPSPLFSPIKYNDQSRSPGFSPTFGTWEIQNPPLITPSTYLVAHSQTFPSLPPRPSSASLHDANQTYLPADIYSHQRQPVRQHPSSSFQPSSGDNGYLLPPPWNSLKPPSGFLPSATNVNLGTSASEPESLTSVAHAPYQHPRSTDVPAASKYFGVTKQEVDLNLGSFTSINPQMTNSQYGFRDDPVLGDLPSASNSDARPRSASMSYQQNFHLQSSGPSIDSSPYHRYPNDAAFTYKTQASELSASTSATDDETYTPRRYY